MPLNLSNLSEEQRRAVLHIGSHARLLAGPGTGKTRVLTQRVGYLINEKEVLPQHILVLTFTRAATFELRQRIAQIVGEGKLPHISTLHSFALKQLLRNSSRISLPLPQPLRIADDWEERHLILEDIKRLLSLSHIDEAREFFHRLSANWQSFVEEDEGPNPEFIGIWQEHRQIFGYTLRSELVYRLARSLQQSRQFEIDPPAKYVLVDEYQDLNPCDLSIVRALADRGAEVFVAGDDDQSIYGFRKAHPEGIRRFVEEYPNAQDLTLTECRRCAPEILDVAQWVIRTDYRREPKRLYSVNGVQGEVRLLQFRDQYHEARGVADICKALIEEEGYAPDEILILTRIDTRGAFSQVIKEIFVESGIPLSANATVPSPLEMEQGRILLGFLRLLRNEADHLAWRTLLQLRKGNQIGEKRLSTLYSLASEHGYTFYEILRRISQTPEIVPFGTVIQSEVEQIFSLLARIQKQDDLDVKGLIIFLGEKLLEDLPGKGSGEREALLSALEFLSRLVDEIAPASLEEFLNTVESSEEKIEQEIESGAVNLLTMHKAKGLTARAVIIIGAEDEIIPGRQEKEPGLGDERRLFYVSLTRAREKLFITYCATRIGQQRHLGRRVGRTQQRTLTRFLQDASLQPIKVE